MGFGKRSFECKQLGNFTFEYPEFLGHEYEQNDCEIRLKNHDISRMLKISIEKNNEEVVNFDNKNSNGVEYMYNKEDKAVSFELKNSDVISIRLYDIRIYQGNSIKGFSKDIFFKYCY